MADEQKTTKTKQQQMAKLKANTSRGKKVLKQSVAKNMKSCNNNCQDYFTSSVGATTKHGATHSTGTNIINVLGIT